MSASCQPAAAHNKCATWKVASNLDTCQNLATPQGTYPTLDSCQVNSASCSNSGIYARWGASAPVRPGPMAKGAPYPFCRSYGFDRQTNMCREVPHTTPGASVGPQSCVKAHSPFVYKGPTF